MYDKEKVIIENNLTGVGMSAVTTPFNGLFVDELKTLVPSAEWKSSRSAWKFKSISLEQVTALVEKYFPPAEQLENGPNCVAPAAKSAVCFKEWSI